MTHTKNQSKKIVLSITPEFDEWITASGGSERGDRQRFIIAILKQIQNGFIIRGTEIQSITPQDLRKNIDILRAEAEAHVRSKEYQQSERTTIFFTPIDILDELKSKFQELGISSETKDTIRVMKEEAKAVSPILTSPLVPSPPPPPPSIEGKK